MSCLFLLILFKLNSGQQIPVLLYHHFLTPEEKEIYNDGGYSVTTTTFEKQMKWLYENGYKSITPDELYCWKKNRCKISSKSFLITIDDGLLSSYKYASPILKKYNFVAAVFLVTSRVKEKTEDWTPTKYVYIGKDIKDKKDGTLIFASHSHELHEMIDGTKKLYTLEYPEILNDVITSREILSTDYFAYPFNTYNSNIRSALNEAGYKLAFRGQNQKTTKHEEIYLTSRIVVTEDMDCFNKIFNSKEFNQKVKNIFTKIYNKIKHWVVK